MALEAIETIRLAERDMQRLCDEATAQGKQLVVKAEQDGLRALDEARRDAQAQGAALIAEAEKQAAERIAKALSQAEQDCLSFRQDAQSRLDRAAALIAERVVTGSCPS